MALERREALILGAVVVAATGVGFLAGPLLLKRRPEGGAALRSASFSDLQGKPRKIDEWRGRVLVVNFWATWCPPCREEIPMLMAVRDKYSSNGVEIVGIAIDLADKVRDYSGSMKISYPVLIADANGLDLVRKLGNSAGGLPYTVFLDRQGEVEKAKLGALKQEELEDSLRQLLAA
jgi:thiol-disulfide isomerase/thioredoxin